MNLPNYFLADLPSEASLTASTVTESCHALKRNREQFLASRSTQSLVELLGHLGKEWLDPNFQFRKIALAKARSDTGFSSQTLARGLDSFFGQLTADKLRQLLEQDLGYAQRLDHFVGAATELQRTAVAIGPEFV